MARTQRKVLTMIATAGIGVVLAANPSGALPWGASLRPSFVAAALGHHDDVPAADPGPSSPDPTIAVTPAAHGSDGAPGAPGAPGASGASSTRPPRPEPTTAASTVPAPPEPPAPPTTATEPEPSAPANLTAGRQQHTATPEVSEPAEPPAPQPTEPTTPPAPPTTARSEERRPATLALGCEVTAGGARATVACSWTGETPEGATSLLVLRNDGRVRLQTSDTARRSHTDVEAPAGRALSYVVVFLDAAGRTIAHSNPAAVTTPPAPPTPPTTTRAPEPTTVAPRPTEPPHPTTTATEPRR